jgi:hypothetical protein
MKARWVIGGLIGIFVLVGSSVSCGGNKETSSIETGQVPTAPAKELGQVTEEVTGLINDVFSMAQRTTEATKFSVYVIGGGISKTEEEIVKGTKPEKGDLRSFLELLRESDGLRIREIRPTGESYIDGKVCDREGVCIGISAHLEQDDQGGWKIYDLVDVSLSDVKSEGRVTTSQAPSKAIEQFFKLLESEKYEQWAELFSSKIRTGKEIEEGPKLRQWLLSILSSVHRVEVTDEFTEEKVGVETIVWKKDVYTRYFDITLKKDQDGKWKIYYVREREQP